MRRFLPLLAVLLSCAPSASFVMRPMGMPRAAGEACVVEFTEGFTDQVLSRGAPIAVINVSNPDLSWTERMKAAVNERMCEIGGGVASFAVAMSNATGNVSSAQILVFPLQDDVLQKANAAGTSGH